jgi:invasion protein IalB
VWRNFISSFVLIISFIISSGVLAQDEQNWVLVCVNSKNPVTCRIVQSLYANKVVDGIPKPMGRILRLAIRYTSNEETKTRMPFLNIKTPLGVNLRAGVVFKVDEYKEVPLTYHTCSLSACDAGIFVDSALLNILKAGRRITVGFVPWGTSEVTVLPVSLSGFTEIFKGVK